MNEQKLSEIQNLLDKAGSIIAKHEAIAHETGSSFNVFDIAGIGWREVPVCRVLAEMLSPDGSHGQGSIYLELFLEVLHNRLKRKYSAEEIKRAEVNCEYSTDKGRRIDIVIEVGGDFIPIEAKIYAGDQERQCVDYLAYAREKFGGNAKVVYLTLDGHAPSEESSGELATDDIIQISFSKDILSWLEKCFVLPETIRKAPVREILMQFISVIKRLTNQWEDKPKMEMANLLFESEQNMRNAKAIMDNMESCRGLMFTKFFDAFRDRFKIPLNNVVAEWDYTNDRDKTVSAEITYMFDEDVEPDISVLFALIANKYDYLCAGYVMCRKDTNGKLLRFGDKKTADELRKRYDISGGKQSAWYLCYDQITYDGKRINLTDFGGNCDNFFKLFNPEKFEQIIDSTVMQAQEIQTYMSKPCSQ